MKPLALDDLDWSADCAALIESLAESGQRFSADDISRDMRKPPVPNMTGAAFQAAAAQNLIHCVGYKLSTNPTRRHGIIRIWEKKGET
ncbi:hypothetical protein [Pseudarthrobacter sp. PS3-L1]|uniref:hypothetical protein n=1 Tax=Pseudarthrobacter sp. PS3-L1 TaxID=3046207 RepID=UPI0024BB0380|nr:hypothetical protein [Pseudarthrobacter sp. PS3-L1]MDJ0321686.1 hypothetical protein [Pseudarthrobacter sp. PS3-L1]